MSWFAPLLVSALFAALWVRRRKGLKVRTWLQPGSSGHLLIRRNADIVSTHVGCLASARPGAIVLAHVQTWLRSSCPLLHSAARMDCVYGIRLHMEKEGTSTIRHFGDVCRL